MNPIKNKSSRRAFFLQGGAALGAGVATTAGATALLPAAAPPQADQLQQLQQQLAAHEDREAIRRLQATFMALIEKRDYEAATELFDQGAHLQLSEARAAGRPAIQQLFAEQYRHQTAPAIHSAYRPNDSQHADTVTLDGHRGLATATFHVDVALSTPLQGDSTIAQMARLQGQLAARRWESGRFDAQFVKTRGQWKIASLSYST